MKPKPSYYAIIPAGVRYDSGVSGGAKLLYGEITALCEKEGYCWASSAYFANLYGVSSRTIQRWILSLDKNSHIRCKWNEKRNERKIYIIEKLPGMYDLGVRQNRRAGMTKMSHGVRQKCPHSITSSITSIKGFSSLEEIRRGDKRIRELVQ